MSQLLSILESGKIQGVIQTIQYYHPDYTNKEIASEVKRILSDLSESEVNRWLKDLGLTA